MKRNTLKNRNNDTWTESRFKAFIKSALRNASMKWGPRNLALKKARKSRGFYLCNSCKEVVPNSIKGEDKKRIKNVYVDHIHPVIDPQVGFISWDNVIERMFCESDGFQVLCKTCHDEKTKEERNIANGRT